MFRILLVEDLFNVRTVLKRQLCENIPEAEIYAVESVSEGKDLIEDAAKNRQPYDAVCIR